MIRTLLLAGLLACAPITVMSQGVDPNMGRNIAANCANCHGTNGVSVGGMPALAGRPRAEMLQMMRDFRDGKRPATIMHQLAKGYTEPQLEAVATYLSSQKPN